MMHNKISTTFSDTSKERGFTFIEFIVIMSIFAIMSTVVLFNFKGFRSSVSVSNLVYDLALEIKTAQTLGVSAPGGINSVINAEPVITVLFDYSSGAFTNSFITFREMTGGSLGEYDQNNDVMIRQSTVMGGVLDDICIQQGQGQSSCSSLPGPVYISFRRPDPEPIITSQSCGGGTLPGFSFSTCTGRLKINMHAKDDPMRAYSIIIEPSGQVHVSSV